MAPKNSFWGVGKKFRNGKTTLNKEEQTKLSLKLRSNTTGNRWLPDALKAGWPTKGGWIKGLTPSDEQAEVVLFFMG